MHAIRAGMGFFRGPPDLLSCYDPRNTRPHRVANVETMR